MGVNADIESGLNVQLEAFASANSLSVSWFGVEFTPTNQAYLNVSLLPNQTGIGGLAPGSHKDYGGIYQIDIRVIKGIGTGELRAIADLLESEFAKAETLTRNTTIIKIENAWQGPVLSFDDKWLSLPFSVQYRVIA